MSIDAGAVSLALKLNSTSFEKSISSVATKAAGLLASALAVNGLLDFGKQCIELGSTMMATESTFATVFSGMENQAEAALTAIAEQAGNTVDSMRSSFTQIAAFAKTTGADTADALDLTTRATTAAADIAAFYDKSIDTVTDSLQSFLKGNYENDAALGLSCTETTRNAAANELYGKSFQDLSEAQKQLTLLQMVEDANKTSGALGQAVRESHTWAIQSQYLAQQTQSFMAAVGQGLINLLTPALTAVNTLMGKVVQMGKAFQSLTEALFGISSAGDTSASDTASDLSSASNSASTLADNLTESGSAAADLKRSLAGFDQITRVEEQDTSSGSSTGTTGVDTGSLDSLTNATAVAESSVSELGSSIPALLQPALTAFERLKESFGRFAEKVKEAGSWVLENILKPLGEWTLTEAVPAGINLLAAAFDVLASVCEALEEPVQWIWDNFLEPIAAWTGDLVIQALNLLTGALEGISSWIDENRSLIEMIVPPIVAFFAAIAAGQAIVSTIATITGAFSGIVGVVTTVIKAFSAASSIGAMLQGMLVAVGGATAPLIVAIAAVVAAGVLLYENWDTVKVYLEAAWTAIQSAAETVFGALQAFWETHGEAITSALTNAWNTITTVLSTVWEGIKTVAMDVFTILQEFWDEHGEQILTAFTNIWEGIQNVLSTVWNKIKAAALVVFGTLKTFWDTWGSTIQKAFSAVWENVKTVFSSAWNVIKSVFKTVLAVLSDVFAIFAAAFSGDWDAVWENASKLLSDVWSGIQSTATAVWDGIKSTITGAIKGAWSVVSSIVSKLKKIFNFSWKLPELKLPHFTVSGEFSLSPLSVPSFSIEWYKKAMNTPMLLDQPTLFGAGEAGPEVVAGAQKLESMISSAVQNSAVASSLNASAQEYQRQGSPSLAAMSRSSELATAASRGSDETETSANVERLEELLEAILALLKDLDPVKLDPESLRKYFIRVTNRNTQANGGRCELMV